MSVDSINQESAVATNTLVDIILSEDDATRNQALDTICESCSLDQLLAHVEALDSFWRSTDNLYHRVRAGPYGHLLERRFIESINGFLDVERKQGASEGMSSALSKAYHELAFQTLADQVRKSVRTVKGNQWMFRTGHPGDHPLRFRQELMSRTPDNPMFPILKETTAVRMDFTHSAWSDIFFLGMDFPSGANVINASVNLGVLGRDESPQPPIECYLRVIDQPIIRRDRFYR